MSARWLPVCPDLDVLKHEARDLLRAMHAGDAEAVAELKASHPDPVNARDAKLADAQLVLARSYQASSWTRLVNAVKLIDAIWRDDVKAVRQIITRNPAMLHEDALVRKNSNWGPPMTYAANVGRDEIIRMLHGMGARDLESALDRAALQGKISTAKMLHEMLGSTVPPDSSLGGPAYTLNAEGTELLLSMGVRVVDEHGKRTAPVAVVLETDSRRPVAKHRILELYAQHGLEYPDTPVMALHRGRIDLLEEHLRRDPMLLRRTFSHDEIYPPDMGSEKDSDATVGTPLGGTTLLHMCVDYGELEIARWLIDQGMDVNTPSRVGANGFGGYTALFCCVVGQPNFWMNFHKRGPFVAPFAELLLEHGANPNVRASLWKELHPGYNVPGRHEFRNVTALSYGKRFPAAVFVSEPAMRLIETAGGVD